MTSVEVKPLWLVRLVARAPRIACITAAVVLSALGLAQLLRGEPRQASEPKTVPRGEDLAANSLAEAYARAFLTVEPASGGLEDPSWRAFGVDLPRPTAPSHAKPQHVTWTATVGDRPMRPGRRIVTVVAGVGSSLTYLAVPIERDDKHRVFVAGPPAIVGPPPIARGASSPAELEVDDPALRDVATRVVRHYLARDSQDLAADLDRSAIVTLPTQPLLLADVEAVTWVSRARLVAVAITATDRDGRRLPLRYELALVRRSGRWLVNTVDVNPLPPEATR